MASATTQIPNGRLEGGPIVEVPTSSYQAAQQNAVNSGVPSSEVNIAADAALSGRTLPQELSFLQGGSPQNGKTYGILGDIMNAGQVGLGLASGGITTALSAAEDYATGQNSLNSTLENVGESIAESELGSLAGDAVGGGRGGAIAGAAAQAGANAGLSELSGGNVTPLSSITAGLQGAANGYGSTTSGAAFGDINPESGAVNGVSNPSGVIENNVSGTYGDDNVAGGTDNISGNGNSLNLGGLTNGISNVSGTGDTNNVSGNPQSTTQKVLSNASGAAGIGQSLQNLLQGLSTSYGSGNIVTGTNEISTPVTAAEAASITPTGSWTDRQLYDGLQAIQQRYAGTGQSNSPQEQAEIQALLSQQVGQNG